TKAAAEDREAEIQPQLQKVKPGDWCKDKTVWFHLNHCCRANDPSETVRSQPGLREGATKPPRRETLGRGERAQRRATPPHHHTGDRRGWQKERGETVEIHRVVVH
ncbi:hypothetical protein L3Q82_021001, partial [Scortum barcoo]